MRDCKRALAAAVTKAAKEGDMEAAKVLASFHQRTENGPRGCWIWTGGKNATGYGRITFRGRHCMAHRVLWELLGHPLDEALTLDHLCCTRACVNPKHLEQVTLIENIRRGWRTNGLRPNKNREKTHCPRGHPFSEENTYLTPSGGRKCRTCVRELGHEWRKANQERVRETKRQFYYRHANPNRRPPTRERTHCPQGHPYSPENTYIIPSSGGRVCRTCHGPEAQRRRRAEKRAASA